MALKTATLYKSLIVRAQSVIETGINGRVPAFYANDNQSITINVKCDNFARQIDIKTNQNLFDYKYITFDKHALFEIVNIVKNEDVYTLFVEYLTNIDLTGAQDKKFYLSDVTANNLRGSGITLDVIKNMIKRAEDFTTTDYIPNASTLQFGWALKFTMSEIPQNLKTGISASSFNLTTSEQVGKFEFNNRISGQYPVNTDVFKIPTFGTVSLIVPIPMRGLDTQNVFTMRNGYTSNTYTLNLTYANFEKAIESLISDLTLKVELIPFVTGTVNNIYRMSPTAAQKLQRFNVSMVSGVYTIQPNGLTLQSPMGSSACGGALRLLNNYIVFVTTVDEDNSQGKANCGIWEARPEITLTLTDNPAKLSYKLKFCGQYLDILDTDQNIRIQAVDGNIRVYKKKETMNYIDIPNTINYAKSAYSNFSAYELSNITRRFQNEADLQKLQQQQNREKLRFDTTFSVAGAIGAAATGNPLGIAAGVNMGLNAVKQTLYTDVSEQNANANLKLRQNQAINDATKMIVPGTLLTGALDLSFLDRDSAGNIVSFSEFLLNVQNELYEKIYKYMIENNIVQSDMSFLTVIGNSPRWLLNNDVNYYCYKLTAKPSTRQKDVYLKGRVIFS